MARWKKLLAFLLAIGLAGLKWEQTGMAAPAGRSLTHILFSMKTGIINPARDHLLIGKERHDIGRPNDWGYPIRGILKGDLLFLRNYETNRWPAGNPETGYLNCDGGATKTDILDARRATGSNRYWSLCFGKRPAVELCDVKRDPDCVNNLADHPVFAETKQRLERQLVAELQAQADPRVFGNGEVFEKHPYAWPGQRGFFERFMRGEKPQAGWVSESDFEKESIPQP